MDKAKGNAMGIAPSTSSYGRWFVYGLPNGSSRYFWLKREALRFMAVISVAEFLRGAAGAR